MPILRLAPLLAVAALVAVPASAAAQEVTRTDYRVVIEGDVDYNRADAWPTDEGDMAFQDDEAFSFRTEIATLSFFGEFGADGAGTGGTASARRGHTAVSHPIGGTWACDRFGVDGFRPGRLVAGLAGEQTQFVARVLEHVTAHAGGCPQVPAFDRPFDANGKRLGAGPFDATFVLPKAQVGLERIVVPLHNRVSGAACNGFHEFARICVLEWEATATFTKTASAKVDVTPVPPPVPPAVPVPLDESMVPMPKPRPVPRPEPLDDLVPMPGAKVAPNGASVSVPVSCTAGCAGVARVSLPGRARAAAAGTGRVIATQRFAFGPTRRATVRVAIPRRSRAAVRRVGAVRVTLTAGPRGGRPVTRQVTVRRGSARSARG